MKNKFKAREFETTFREHKGIEIDIWDKEYGWDLSVFISYDNPHWAADFAREDYKLVQYGYEIISDLD